MAWLEVADRGLRQCRSAPSLSLPRPSLPPVSCSRRPHWQLRTRCRSPGNTLVTVEGTDVFTVVSLSGTNDPVSTGLMLKLVNRVSKLR
jgi:hypothetical protein